MRKWILTLILIAWPLMADVRESWSKPEAQVGETVILYLMHTHAQDWQIPQQGFLYDKKKQQQNLPYAQIVSIDKTPGKIQIQVVFLMVGQFSLPVSWLNTISQQREKTVKTIEIRSSLKGEKQLLDISSPISYSGPYLLRLIFMILVGIVIFSLSVYGVYYLAKKHNEAPRNAIISQPQEFLQTNHYEKLLQQYIRDGQIRHKDFLFALTGYIKERLEYYYREPCRHQELVELSPLVKRKCSIQEEDWQKVLLYFDSIKYMPNNELISNSEAQELFRDWQEKLA